MQFRVPQYIDVEDKIFGPFTFKQFVYMFGGAGGAFLVYAWVPTPLNYPIMVIIIATALALTFYKVNNRPFAFIMESAIRYYLGAKLYIWQKSQKQHSQVTGEKETGRGEPQINIPKISQSQLKDLAWSLDVKDKIR